MQNQALNSNEDATPPHLVVVDRIKYEDVPGMIEEKYQARIRAERMLSEPPPPGGQELSNRLALFMILTNLYTEECCYDAAFTTLRRAEPVFFELIEQSEDWINPPEISLFLDLYSALEKFEDARRIAEAAMEILSKRPDYEPGDETWLLEVWLDEISTVEERHSERLRVIERFPTIDPKEFSETTGLNTAFRLYFPLLDKLYEA